MFKVSCIQLKSNDNKIYNLKKTERLIKKAVSHNTDFVLTPEVSSLFSLEKKITKNLYFYDRRYLFKWNKENS